MPNFVVGDVVVVYGRSEHGVLHGKPVTAPYITISRRDDNYSTVARDTLINTSYQEDIKRTCTMSISWSGVLLQDIY